MALSIKNPKAEQLAEAVAQAAGETKTQAVITALEERLLRLSGRRTAPDIGEQIMEISRRCAALPLLDNRTEDEILGYNDIGTFD